MLSAPVMCGQSAPVTGEDAAGRGAETAAYARGSVGPVLSPPILTFQLFFFSPDIRVCPLSAKHTHRPSRSPRGWRPTRPW